MKTGYFEIQVRFQQRNCEKSVFSSLVNVNYPNSNELSYSKPLAVQDNYPKIWITPSG